MNARAIASFVLAVALIATTAAGVYVTSARITYRGEIQPRELSRPHGQTIIHCPRAAEGVRPIWDPPP